MFPPLKSSSHLLFAKMRIFPFVLILFCLAGCQTTEADLPDFKKDTPVTFISFPPGAVIEIDGEYKGRTPNIIQLSEYHLEKDRYAKYFKVFVYPTQEGYCMQKKTLNPYQLLERVEFDLTDCSNNDDDPSVLPNGNLGIHPETPTF